MWKKWTYQQYYDDSVQFAKALLKVGHKPTQAVCILGFNSPGIHCFIILFIVHSVVNLCIQKSGLSLILEQSLLVELPVEFTYP